MSVTVSARFVDYEGSERCRVSEPFGPKCSKRAEVVTIFEGSNGWSYVANPRCRADAEYLLGDVPLA
jgi:hypothetical protein